MNLKTTILALIAFCLILTTEAREVSFTDAELVAKNFIYITSNKFDKVIAYEDIRLTEPYSYRVADKPVFYAFQMNPGFIIISAEDVVTPVIGYSFEGRFDLDEAPANYRGFILNYAEQVLYARENKVEASLEVANSWNELRSTNIENLVISRERDVAPLVDCTWDQGYPYNIFCPEDPAGPGGYTWVGCVATAMAQIMYYWRYPETGTGYHCYIPGHYSYGQQCADYTNTTYKWSEMINSVDNKNPEPNAELQYHCAVSVNMNFDPDGSGAQSSTVPGSLNQYFRYNNAEYKQKQNYTQAGWIALLKADIDLKRPVYYSGYNPTQGGHAFVCDGYQGDNFHFNFGWSGSGNGYYSLSDVNGFYQGQACVRNFIPSDNAYPYHNTGTVNITGKSGSITDGSGPAENYLDNNTAYWLIDPQTIYDSISSVKLMFSKFDLAAGDTVKVYDGGTTSDALLGAYSGTTLPPWMTSTGNRMLIEFKTNGTGNATGWYAEYSTTSPSWCQGLVQMTDPSGTFDDGSGDFHYQSGATCMWRIKPEYANKIILSFNYFDTEEGVDKLKVYDGNTLLGEFSGNEIPESVEAASGTMTVTWTTSVTNNMQGWEAFYEVDNVGIREGSAVAYLEVYPNPASSDIHVRFSVEEKSKLGIRLVNLTGQIYYSEEYPQFAGDFQKEISVSHLPAGVYFLEINTVSGTTSKKILVSK